MVNVSAMACGTLTRSTSVFVKFADPVSESVPPATWRLCVTTKSSPIVRVSTALVKNCAVVTPSRWNGARSRWTTAPTAGSELWNWLEITMRSAMVMR